MARRGRSQARRNDGGSLPGWAWLMIGAALALLVVLVAPKYFGSGPRDDGFFRPRPNPDARPAISALEEVEPPTATPRPLPTPVMEPAPEFDFYTVLPAQETALSDAELAARARAEAGEAADEPAPAATTARPSAPAAPPATPTRTPHPPATPTTAVNPPPAGAAAASPSRYLLQAGAFSNPAEAESLKAQIALLGLQARIEPGTVDGKPIHRVRLGPYTSASELTAIKERLGNGGLTTLAVRVE